MAACLRRRRRRGSSSRVSSFARAGDSAVSLHIAPRRASEAAMRAIRDPDQLLGDGLAAIRAQFKIPAGFPPEVLAAADAAAAKVPTEHADRTALAFVTLDPAASPAL